MAIQDTGAYEIEWEGLTGTLIVKENLSVKEPEPATQLAPGKAPEQTPESEALPTN